MRKPQRRIIFTRGSAEYICPRCGTVFRRPNSQVTSALVCCSLKCANILRQKRPLNNIEKTCEECGKPFFVKPSRAETGRFCSIRCVRTSVGRSMRGENHPFWKGGKSKNRGQVRTAIRRRIKETEKCERCGSTDDLQGHHKHRVSSRPDLARDSDNIEILCASCHAAEHPEISGFILGGRNRRKRHFISRDEGP